LIRGRRSIATAANGFRTGIIFNKETDSRDKACALSARRIALGSLNAPVKGVVTPSMSRNALPIVALIRAVVVDDSTGYPGAPESVVSKKDRATRDNGTEPLVGRQVKARLSGSLPASGLPRE
jgi:hypothetical protein